MARPPEPLDEFLRELKQELPDLGGELPELLRRTELPIQRAQRGKGPPGKAPWFLHVKPAEHIRESFELAPELLVMVLPASEPFALDIQQAEARLAEDLRLDAGLVLAIVQNQEAATRLAVPVARTGRNYVFVEFQLLASATDPLAWLRTQLREQLGSADLFEPSRPVTGWDFFGRDTELKRLRQYIIAGKPVGLYGLRKTGKTSLALRCLEQLGAEGSTIGIHIDMQTLVGIETNFAGFMRRLLRSLSESLERLGLAAKDLELAADFADTRNLRKAADQDIQRLGIGALEAAIDWTDDEPSRRVVLFIDEYERLFDQSIFPSKDALEILDYLRGLVQTYPTSFDFMIAGLSRRFAEQSRFGERQNPLFGFVIDFPIAGLERGALQGMFRKIGKRVGLRFAADSLDFIYRQTGGHPALARKYGRLVDRRVPLSERANTYQVSRALVVNAISDFALQASSTMQEIHIACRDIDASAPFALAQLAHDPHAPDSLATEHIEQLRRLGIINKIEQGWIVGIGCFADWLRLNVNPSLAVGT